MLNSIALSKETNKRIIFNQKNYTTIYWFIIFSLLEKNNILSMSIGIAKNISHNLVWIIKFEDQEIICFESYEEIINYVEEQDYFSYSLKDSIENMAKKIAKIL